MMERSLADEGEGLIVENGGIGVDAAQIDAVGASDEILNRIDGGSARVAQSLKDESVRAATADEQVLAALAIELVAARAALQHVVAAAPVKRVVARSAFDRVRAAIAA